MGSNHGGRGLPEVSAPRRRSSGHASSTAQSPANMLRATTMTDKVPSEANDSPRHGAWCSVGGAPRQGGRAVNPAALKPSRPHGVRSQLPGSQPAASTAWLRGARCAEAEAPLPAAPSAAPHQAVAAAAQVSHSSWATTQAVSQRAAASAAPILLE